MENTSSAGFQAGSAGIQILVQSDTQLVLVWWKPVQPVFALFTFFCQSVVSAAAF
jgi:hypothetical protein